MSRTISWTIPSGVVPTSQKVQKRLKGTSVWDDTGFNPTNVMGSTVTSASVTLLPNRIYEFQQLIICGGSTLPNSSGIKEGIEFACIAPTITTAATSSTLTLSTTGTSITGARLTLRKLSDNSVSYGPVVVQSVSDAITATANGLMQSSQYGWQVELSATIGGQTIYSSIQSQLSSLCGPYSSQTGTSFSCITPTSFDIFEPEGGIGIIVQGTNVTAAKFYLKKTSDSSIVFSQRVDKTQTYDGGSQTYIDVCVVQVPANIQATYIDGEQYQWYYEMFNTTNGVETGSQTSIGYCNQTPWMFPAVQCIEPTISSTETTSTIKIDVGNGPYYKALLLLKDSNGNTVSGFPITKQKESSGQDLNKIVVQATGLTQNSQYTWSYQLVSSFNNQDVVHTNACGDYVTNTNTQFTIYPEPVNQTVNEGSNTSFSSAAIGGNGPIVYQWQTTTATNPVDSDWTDFPNANGVTFNINNAQLSQNGLGVRQTATQNGVTIKSTLARLYVNATPKEYYWKLYTKTTDPDTGGGQTPNLTGATLLITGTIPSPSSVITVPTSTNNYASIDNKYLILEIQQGVNTRTQYQNGASMGAIPGSVFRPLTSNGTSKFHTSADVWFLNANDPLIFT